MDTRIKKIAIAVSAALLFIAGLSSAALLWRLDQRRKAHAAANSVLMRCESCTPADLARVLDLRPDINTRARNGETFLTCAMTKADLALVVRIIRSGADVDATDPLGFPAISLAVMADRPEWVALLLAEGADREQPDRAKWKATPLLWAAGVGSLQATELLLDAGANVNARDSLGQTPLMRAVSGREPRHEAIARKLLSSGADPSVVDQQGLDALKLARLGGRQQLIALLKGAVRANAVPDPNVLK
jgi:uncharacterized protein